MRGRRKQVSSHRQPSEMQRGSPPHATVPTWRGTYRLYKGPCSLSSPLYPLRSHQKCSHNRVQRRPKAPRRKQSPRPPATQASSGEAFSTPSSSPGGKGRDGTGRWRRPRSALMCGAKGTGAPLPAGRLLSDPGVFRCPETCGCRRDSREGKKCLLPPSCREKLARGLRVGGGQVRSSAPGDGEGQLRANSALAERALAACQVVLLAAELPAAAAGRAAPRRLSCHRSSGSRAAPPPLPGPGGRARAAAAACARRRRRRSGKMNPVCTSAHLN